MPLPSCIQIPHRLLTGVGLLELNRKTQGLDKRQPKDGV